MGAGSGVFCEARVPQRLSPSDVWGQGEELGSFQAVVASPSASGQRPRFLPSPFPLPGDGTRPLTGPACPRTSHQPEEGHPSQGRVKSSARESAWPLSRPFRPRRPPCSNPAGMREEQEGAGAGSVVRGLLSSPLCFHGDFISSKLLIELHIYGQKIKSLDLFQVEFYES